MVFQTPFVCSLTKIDNLLNYVPNLKLTMGNWNHVKITQIKSNYYLQKNAKKMEVIISTNLGLCLIKLLH